nr:MAG TPA: hypothetical protein [Caudoviricetes sp.]
MNKRVAIPIYWVFENYENYNDILIRNVKVLNEEYLDKGWEIERVDELKDINHPILMYILKREE